MDIVQQEHTLSTNYQILNALKFCHFETNCKTIKCCCIPEQLDPGEVTRIFIENIFKDKCGSNIAISLILKKSTFPGNQLRNMWLKTNVTIDELIIDNCFLTTLSDTAFASMIYNRTTKLHLRNNNISILRRATFRHLPSLQHLAIEGNLIREAEKNLLKDIALQCLQFEDAIENLQVLRNITGADDLPTVQVLSLRYNHIPLIDSQLLSGVPNMVSLYLCDSDVKTIYADAFESISRSLKQLVLSNNAIASLPRGVFNSIIRRNADFGLTIDNNPWHCNCGLQWMQEMMKQHPNVMKKNLTCVSPKRNAGKFFTSAKFCDGAGVTPSLSTYVDITTYNRTITMKATEEINTSNVMLTTEPTIRVNCVPHDRFFYSTHLRDVPPTIEISLPLSNFTAKQLKNESVLITLPDMDDLSLLWFANNERLNITNLNNSIQCVGKLKKSYLLDDLQPRTSYTICLQDNLTNFSPLNCLGLTTRSLPEHHAWLNGIDESIIIAIFVGSLMLVCFLSAILMFIIVRRHPTMLRGSKRVVMVKRRKAIVLPKGLSSDTVGSAKEDAIPTISRNFKENGYVTPVPLARNLTRKDSKRSRRLSEQSDGTSYISGIELTSSQLNSWRKREDRMNWEAEPPPLPPYPRHKAQPLSAVEDSNENGAGDPMCRI